MHKKKGTCPTLWHGFPTSSSISLRGSHLVRPIPSHHPICWWLSNGSIWSAPPDLHWNIPLAAMSSALRESQNRNVAVGLELVSILYIYIFVVVRSFNNLSPYETFTFKHANLIPSKSISINCSDI